MSDELARSWREYPLVAVLCVSTGIGAGYFLGRSHLGWMTDQRDRFKTEYETAKASMDELGKEQAKTSVVLANALSASKRASDDLRDARQKQSELETSLEQARRDLAAKGQQADSVAAENVKLKQQLPNLKPNPPVRPFKVEEEAKVVITALYRSGTVYFKDLKKALDLPDGTVRHHLLGLNKAGLVDYSTNVGTDDIYSAKLSVAGLRYARENGID